MEHEYRNGQCIRCGQGIGYIRHHGLTECKGRDTQPTPTHKGFEDTTTKSANGRYNMSDDEPELTRPRYWDDSWPELWWTDFQLPMGWMGYEKLPDGSCKYRIEAEDLGCEQCCEDDFDDDDDFYDEPDPNDTPLTDGDVQRFLELWFPFVEQRRAGKYTGQVYAVDEEGIEIRPLDPQLQQPLLLLCTRHRLERMEELSDRPAMEKMGCTGVLLTIAISVVLILLL
ncbi:MAG: hypothetical protein NTZ32_21980 [Planctomycetales bacterium]|nr:hypothetical protein [Planctomycetales bacterium]